jgi:hypothetical protein
VFVANIAGGRATHARPMAKTMQSMILLQTLTFNFQSKGIGMRKMKKSERILMRFATIPKGRRLMQCPGSSVIHHFLTGKQPKVVTPQTHVCHRDMKTSMMITVRWNLGLGKTRW